MFSHCSSKVTNTITFRDLSLPYKCLRFMDIEMHTKLRPWLLTQKESTSSRWECRFLSLHLSTILISFIKIYSSIHKMLFIKLVLNSLEHKKSGKCTKEGNVAHGQKTVMWKWEWGIRCKNRHTRPQSTQWSSEGQTSAPRSKWSTYLKFCVIWVVAQLVKCLPDKLEYLSSIPFPG